MFRALTLLAYGAALQACLPFPGLPAAALVTLGGVLLCLGMQRAGAAVPGVAPALLRRGAGGALGAAALWLAGALLAPFLPSQAAMAVPVFYWGVQLDRCETTLRALEQFEALLERDPAPLALSRARLRLAHFIVLCAALVCIRLPAVRPGYALAAVLLALWQAAVLVRLRKNY